MRNLKACIYSIFLFFILILGSCTEKPPKASEIYDNYKYNVVLVSYSYYYKVMFGSEVRYSIYENDKYELYESVKEIKSLAPVNYGTGFLISKDGKIVTSKNIINSSSPKAVEEELKAELKEYQNELKEDLKEKQELKDTLLKYYILNRQDMSFAEHLEFEEMYDGLEDEIEEVKDVLELFAKMIRNTKVELVQNYFSIAFNETYIESIDDFINCEISQKNNNDDLLVLQISNLNSLKNNSSLFDYKTIYDIPKAKTDDKVYMISFSNIENSSQVQGRINAQFTEGTIIQEPQNKRIVYSLSSATGADGGPVIDKWGNLLAINYLDYKQSKNNFGIPSKHIEKYFSSEEISTAIKSLESEKSNKKKRSNTEEITSQSDYYYKKEIRDLLRAEDRREIETILTYFDFENLDRYWNLNRPSKREVRAAYNKAWSAGSESKNKIVLFEKINEKEFHANVEFSFYSTYEKEWKTVNNTVKYVFGPNDKIVEVYGLY